MSCIILHSTRLAELDPLVANGLGVLEVFTSGHHRTAAGGAQVGEPGWGRTGRIDRSGRRTCSRRSSWPGAWPSRGQGSQDP